ncbi:cytochrome-c peroxidase [Terrimonas rubra]|uniref:Cytochrome-c peroxidase n=1 Tax=Terrimonas rubra TaxID=1035890 RepID=A0ABW6A5B6_9BACT
MPRSITIIGIIVLLVTGLSILSASCRRTSWGKDLNRVQQSIPDGFPEPYYRYTDNPLSEEGIALGRKLFYEGRLSVDGNFPCASCHEQRGAFGLFEHDRSHGYNNSHTLRNGPPLFNLAWQQYYHWDGEFTTLTDAIAQPINGHLEMADDFTNIIAKLQADVNYRKEFKAVFNTQFIQPRHVLMALSQFLGTFVTANSKYDRVKKGQAVFTAEEQQGYTLFLARCNTCHTEPLFTDGSFRNTGLPVDPLLNDYGRLHITRMREDSLKFKVPSLRNVAVSSNYMHDGRFLTMVQALNHYRSNVQQSATLDPLLNNGIPMNDTELLSIVAFLRTLTDSSFITNPALSRP